MKKMLDRPRTFTLVFAIAFVLAITIVAVIWTYSLPWGCNDMSVLMGCAKVDDDGEVVWQTERGAVSCSPKRAFGSLYMYRLAAALRMLSCQKADELPSDMQVVEIEFLNTKWDENGSPTESTQHSHLLLGYDFYQDKVYLFKNEVWYQANKTDKLDGMIEEMFGQVFSHRNVVWLGQSTYSAEEFAETDFSAPTFRYHLHWKLQSHLREYRNTDFKNISPIKITNGTEAVERAAHELDFETPVAITFYDETCGWWLVELYNDVGQTWDDLQDCYDFMCDNVYTVVIDEKGRTVEVYQAVTRGRAFTRIFFE